MTADQTSRRCVLALPMALGALSAQAQARGRVALVIGNGAYRGSIPALPNPPRDADDLARVLRRLGFAVDLQTDATAATIQAAVTRLAAAARGTEAALFFYAGHAVEVGGRNVLIPIGATEADGFPLDSVSEALRGRAATTLIFLDACRDNPFLPATAAGTVARGTAASRGRTRSVGGGLATVRSGAGMLIAFATAPGDVALDGEGRNSPFTAALLQHIETPDVEVREMLGAVRRTVREATRGTQVPWDNSSLETRFVFFQAPRGAARPASPGPRTMEAAATRGIPLPSDALVRRFEHGSSPAHAFVGAWSSGERGWGARGRKVLLIVYGIDSTASRAHFTYAEGPLGPTSYTSSPASYREWTGTIENGSLRYASSRGNYEFVLSGRDTINATYVTHASVNPPNARTYVTLSRIE